MVVAVCVVNVHLQSDVVHILPKVAGRLRIAARGGRPEHDLALGLFNRSQSKTQLAGLAVLRQIAAGRCRPGADPGLHRPEYGCEAIQRECRVLGRECCNVAEQVLFGETAAEEFVVQ